MKKRRKLLILISAFALSINLQSYKAICTNDQIKTEANLIEINFNGKMAITDEEEDKVRLRISSIPEEAFVLITNTTTNEKKVYPAM